ncbi:phosphoribosylanthranilate isomerase [Kitasatospora viridis]|uniref:N-(5'-phosphoribosyl)anthranilate isomerase n=1 Tax=Kitasatospora viridis TaxID=281105 RepID=A0A561UBX5_9ACTN|nr:phosphoribosylanthranilate isomerase [Kitasatospora viridis]TWF96867.1 phosphoribosylanthranilate isomerase [Kitasatospora viridis]
MFVKVCGVRTPGDVAAAVEAGADAIGFVLTESVRRLDPAEARELAALVPPHVLTVAVTAGVPAAEAGRRALAAGVQALQLHGDYLHEDFAEVAALPLRLLRATALRPGTDLATGAFGEEFLLLDAPVAGSGARWDLSLLDAARPRGHWLLAGGLTPANVADAIRAARPWGVDVSSGVESSRGVKDHGLIREFVANARGAALA